METIKEVTASTKMKFIAKDMDMQAFEALLYGVFSFMAVNNIKETTAVEKSVGKIYLRVGC